MISPFRDPFYRLGSIADAGPLAGGGSVLSSAQPAPGTIVLPPQDFMPVDATPFFLSAETAIVGPNVASSPAALQLRIPLDQIGWVKSIEIMLDGIVITSNVLWRLSIDGVPVQGFSNLTILGRNGAASVSRTFDPVTAQIPPGTTLGVTMTVVDGGSYTVGAQLRGWYYPVQRA